MSIIHINQIANKIKPLFEDHIDCDDLNQNDPSYDEKLLTRCLAAYAVYLTLDCTAAEAGHSVVDGSDDNGIDAIYYSALNKKMVIVQSKWSKEGKNEPKSGDVSKFCDGIKDLFNTEFDRFNDKVRAKTNVIETALSEYDTKYEIVLIDTHTKSDLAEHATRKINDLLAEMNNTGEDSQEQIVTYRRLFQGKVYKSLARNSGDEPIDLELNLTNWGIIAEPYKAFYGVVNGNEIADWWEGYGIKLFDKNIRQVLGITDVNAEIKNTIENNQSDFWYFNNGITVICDNIEKSKIGGSNRDYGRFKLTNVAIVNGAQTVSTIGRYEVTTQKDLEELKVHLRVISLSDTPPNFGEQVTRTNNRQNRIENRDFVTQDPEQLRIKTELMIEDIEYSIMRSESFEASDRAFDLSEATISLVCSKNKTSLTAQAKRGIGKFYESLEKGIYKEVFNQSVQGIYVYNCVRVNRVIERVILEEIQKLSKKSGKKYGTLVHGNRIISQLTFYKLALGNALNNLDFEPDESHIKQVTLDMISELEQQLEDQFPENILGTLFKNTSKCTSIVSAIES